MEKGSSYILLQWLPPLDVNHNGRIRHYIISLKNGNSSNNNITTPTSQLSINIGSLQSDSAYTCAVAAVTISPGPFSTPVTFSIEYDGKIRFHGMM